MNKQQGFIIPALLGVMIAFGIIAAAVGSVVLNNFFIVGNNVNRQQALNIAEGGLNYYLWHLNHNPGDYQDGTTGATLDPTLGYGPFVHTYTNADAVKSGTYTIYIKPPAPGSSIVTVRSIGKVANTNTNRTVVAQLGPTSFANYAVLSDSELWFGNNETANGPVHSNQGVRMDGASNDQVTSAKSTYTPSLAYGGDGTSKPGVWCNSSVTTPVNCNTRSKSSWSYPVTSIDFNQVAGSLCNMKKTAFASNSATASLATSSTACNQAPTTRTSAYLPRRSTIYSSSRGYMIELNPNSTYNLYQVNGENDLAANYGSALTLTSIANNIPLPTNNVIFAEDNVWVRTNSIFSGRVTIAAGRLADTLFDANITIVDQMRYSTKNGDDAIGLVSEGNTYLSPYAPPQTGAFNFELDSAILSQNGTVGYPANYILNTLICTRGWVAANQTLNFYGSIATRQNWTWTYQSGIPCGYNVRDSSSGYYISGIEHNTTTYDYNLQSNPPPLFPTTGGYNFLSWREVLTKP